MHKLVLIRHGESVWNRDNLFTGWTDVDLSARGVAQSMTAGQNFIESGYTFDLAYTSVLKRAIRTLWIILDKMDLMWIPVYRSWRLNERHYGALQGLNKNEMTEKHGKDQVLAWRRGFAVRPPCLRLSDPRHPIYDPIYASLNQETLPAAESLQDTMKRFLPFWKRTIASEIKSGKRIIISAHGNSLRALIKHLEHISDEDIEELEIRSGIPLIYELDKRLEPMAKSYLEIPDKGSLV